MPDLRKKNKDTFSSYDILFGDLPLSYWGSIDSKELPWNLFKDVKKNIDNYDKDIAVDLLNQIVNMQGLESRQYLQGYHFLNELLESESADTKIFGVVLEINMPQGNDTLAAYADHSARYYNYSGKSIIWEHPDNSLDTLIDGIFEHSKNVVAQIGPWKNVRPEPPINNMARINFLTSKGLHFGEASQQILFNDAMAGKLMYAMLNLMNALIDRSTSAN
ncbi:MAG: hypothetical protein ABIP30_03555 [Ferruginibacter sp.]